MTRRPGGKLPMKRLAIFLLHGLLSTAALMSAGPPAPPATGLRVAADFEGGSAEVVGVNAATSTVRIMPALHPERGWPCWWYLRLDGLEIGQTVTLEVQAQTKPFRPGSVLSADWCQPERAAISTDNVKWEQTGAATFTPDKAAAYRFRATTARVWLAWGPPFVPPDADALLESIASKLPAQSARFDLAKTRGGRTVKGIRIGPEPASRQVWVNARQHAWEAGGSWVGRGFIEWCAGEDPAARALRETTCIHFVPVMDVDNTALGAGGKDATPRDHNRDWSAQPVYPEIAAAQERIRNIHAAHGLDVYIDLHNPGRGEKAPYFFGPFGFDKLGPIQRRNYERWLELASESISGPLRLNPKYLFANYVKTDEERGRMSSGWVRAHTGEATISVTLETAWNTPASTQEGYMTVGRQLAQAIARYLGENPRRPADGGGPPKK